MGAKIENTNNPKSIPEELFLVFDTAVVNAQRNFALDLGADDLVIELKKDLPKVMQQAIQQELYRKAVNRGGLNSR